MRYDTTIGSIFDRGKQVLTGLALALILVLADIFTWKMFIAEKLAPIPSVAITFVSLVLLFVVKRSYFSRCPKESEPRDVAGGQRDTRVVRRIPGTDINVTCPSNIDTELCIMYRQKGRDANARETGFDTFYDEAIGAGNRYDRLPERSYAYHDPSQEDFDYYTQPARSRAKRY